MTNDVGLLRHIGTSHVSSTGGSGSVKHHGAASRLSGLRQ